MEWKYLATECLDWPFHFQTTNSFQHIKRIHSWNEWICKQHDWMHQFSRLVMSDSLRPHGLQHARLPCPSPTSKACWNSCPLSQWGHPTIWSYVVPSPPSFNLSQHQSLFQWVSSSHQVAKVLEFQLQHQSFQWVFRTDYLCPGLMNSGWILKWMKSLFNAFFAVVVAQLCPTLCNTMDYTTPVFPVLHYLREFAVHLKLKQYCISLHLSKTWKNYFLILIISFGI